MLASAIAGSTMFPHHFSTVIVHNPQLHAFSPFPSTLPPNFKPLQTLNFPRNLNLPPLSSSRYPRQQDGHFEENVIGDYVVFEKGIFDDPVFENNLNIDANKRRSKKKKKKVAVNEANNLVPDKWREVQLEVKITNKGRRLMKKKKFKLEKTPKVEFHSKVDMKIKELTRSRDVNLDRTRAYKEARLARLKPLVLDRPPSFSFAEKEEVLEDQLSDGAHGERVEPKNPRLAVYGRGLEDVIEFFNSEKYDPAAAKNTEGRSKLFTNEEEDLLSMQKPDLAVATSDKWLPLHTHAVSGESFLLDSLLKHDVDINAADKNGLTALHKAIIGKKQGMTNYLLRNSANPFVRDKDGATVMHYAVQTAAIPTIKVLLWYKVDINLQDNDGWTPLHLAVQTQRTDLVKLLLIKGADKTLKNKDGLTPLELCLYYGQSVRTYELIKLLKFSERRTFEKIGLAIEE